MSCWANATVLGTMKNIWSIKTMKWECVSSAYLQCPTAPKFELLSALWQCKIPHVGQGGIFKAVGFDTRDLGVQKVLFAEMSRVNCKPLGSMLALFTLWNGTVSSRPRERGRTSWKLHKSQCLCCCPTCSQRWVVLRYVGLFSNVLCSPLPWRSIESKMHFVQLLVWTLLTTIIPSHITSSSICCLWYSGDICAKPLQHTAKATNLWAQVSLMGNLAA